MAEAFGCPVSHLIRGFIKPQHGLLDCNLAILLVFVHFKKLLKKRDSFQPTWPRKVLPEYSSKSCNKPVEVYFVAGRGLGGLQGM